MLNPDADRSISRYYSYSYHCLLAWLFLYIYQFSEERVYLSYNIITPAIIDSASFQHLMPVKSNSDEVCFLALLIYF